MKKWLTVVGLLILPMLAMADGNYTPALVVSSTTNQGFLYQIPVSTNTGGLLVQSGGVFNWSNTVIGTTSSVTTQQFPGTPHISLAQSIALAPGDSGQFAFCTNCTVTPLIISTGTGIGAWVAVSVSSGATTGFGVPK